MSHDTTESASKEYGYHLTDEAILKYMQCPSRPASPGWKRRTDFFSKPYRRKRKKPGNSFEKEKFSAKRNPNLLPSMTSQ